MNSIDAQISQGTKFGLWSWSALKARGYSDWEIDLAVRDGSLRRIVRGWFASPEADSNHIRAVREGCRIGCLSACRHHGLWIPPSQGLHLISRPGSPGLSSTGSIVHREPHKWDTVLVPLEDALAQVARYHDTESALIVAESAVYQKRIGAMEAAQILEEIPGSRSAAVKPESLLSESGSETRISLFFRSNRIAFRQQVEIPHVGRVDFLVGRSLIVEADSRAHHSEAADYARDRRRDAFARSLGYDCIRLSYNQIWESWEATAELLTAVIRTRKHLREPRPLRFG